MVQSSYLKSIAFIHYKDIQTLSEKKDFKIIEHINNKVAQYSSQFNPFSDFLNMLHKKFSNCDVILTKSLIVILLCAI